MLNVEGLMASAFSNAVENPENINEDGTLNWNFVEADVWMDLSVGMWFREKWNDLLDVSINLVNIIRIYQRIGCEIG